MKEHTWKRSGRRATFGSDPDLSIQYATRSSSGQRTQLLKSSQRQAHLTYIQSMPRALERENECVHC